MKNVDWVSFLNAEELELVRRCLVASAEGPYFDDWEFHAIFGLTRIELYEVLSRWPDLSLHEDRDVCAIFNSMNNLCGYPHGEEKKLEEEFSLKRTEIRPVLEKLRKCKAAS